MATKEELIQRWDAFLIKIEERFNQSLQHAADACKEQLVDTNYEYDTVMRSWGGMKAQINDLIEKIDQTWDTKVGSAMKAVGDFYSDENDKAYDLNHKLTFALEAFQRELEGELSEQFYNHAILIANKKASCTQCNADVAIRKDIFRAQYITCGYCNTVNTIEPETKFLNIGWGIVDNIAALRTTDKYNIMLKAVDSLQEQRKPVAESYWTAYEKTYYDYWESFFKEKIKLSSHAEERYEADMDRKRKEFENYKEIQTK
jgi:hypothetical protein